MPLYEYHCPDCRRDCELLVRSAEKPVCPTCGGKQLHKLLSVPAAHLGGSKDQPLCNPLPMAGGCGRPACGSGGCGI